VAAPAYAGIPLTHRKYASSVSFITGHEDPAKEESAHNWEALAKSASTLVFFMGMKNLPEISRNLIAAGMDPETPAAVVHRGTTCRQRSIAASLADLPQKAEEAGIGAPSLIVVGRVVELRDTLAFFEQKPLLGKGVVVTRAREQASGLVAMLDDMGACVHQFPTIDIHPLDDYQDVERAILNLAAYDWLVFTSVNGVKYFWMKLAEAGLDTRILGGCEVAAIGPATAEALADKGVKADFVPEKYVAEHVVSGLLERGVEGKSVLIPRAREAREVLPTELAKAGAKVEVLPVYETKPAAGSKDEVLDGIKEGSIHCITFASSSTVDNFFSVVHPEIMAAYKGIVKMACIGPVTADTLRGYGLEPDIQPRDYTIPALAQAVADALGG
jgi:uroporphyrinogen III methyltransferase/synthase